jgi:hypothetical protein
MVVRIRLRRIAPRTQGGRVHRQSALIVSALMTPIALMAFALGCWRIAADLKLTGSFAISDGVFAHWQVWIAIAIAVQFAAFLLQKYARPDGQNGLFSD